MKFLLLLMLSLSLHAKLLLSPYDALMLNFGDTIVVHKKSIILSSKDAKAVTALAGIKLETKLYKTFSAYEGEKLLGYGVLALHKVRTKSTAVLSIIKPDGTLKAIEIVAFNEPLEYLPSKRWTKLIHDAKLTDSLALGKDIPSITGSTLSARAVIQSSRIALAIFDVRLKEK